MSSVQCNKRCSRYLQTVIVFTTLDMYSKSMYGEHVSNSNSSCCYLGGVLGTSYQVEGPKNNLRWWGVVISALLFQDQAPRASVENEG